MTARMSDEEFEAACAAGPLAAYLEARRARASETALLAEVHAAGAQCAVAERELNEVYKERDAAQVALVAIDAKLEHATCSNSVNWPEWKAIKDVLQKAGRR
jgi:hypothetical protein